jgi:hypothetical protein
MNKQDVFDYLQEYYKQRTEELFTAMHRERKVISDNKIFLFRKCDKYIKLEWLGSVEILDRKEVEKAIHSMLADELFHCGLIKIENGSFPQFKLNHIKTGLEKEIKEKNKSLDFINRLLDTDKPGLEIGTKPSYGTF